MIYKRYKFNNKEQANIKITEQGEDTKASFIRLNKFVEQEGEYTDGEEEITPPTLSEGYAIDVLWWNLDESPQGWAEYEVEPITPKHKLL